MHNKRGLSTIIATVLIILLVLIAIGIVAVFITNLIGDTGKEIDLQRVCLLTDVEPVSCSTDGSSNIVRLRKGDARKISEIIAVVTTGSGVSVTQRQRFSEATPAVGLQSYSLDVSTGVAGWVTPSASMEAGVVVHNDDWENTTCEILVDPVDCT